MYGTRYERFGMLGYQIWRAARLVVDTAVHSKGWTREQALKYMHEYTALPEHEIETEVDRYIAWPAQALSYYMGELAIVRAREHGLDRTLVGLKMLDRSIPRHGYPVTTDDRQVGMVTSGNVSFTLGFNIAMAYVPPALAQPGTRLAVDVRGTAAPAEVVPLPFYKRPHPK